MEQPFGGVFTRRLLVRLNGSTIWRSIYKKITGEIEWDNDLKEYLQEDYW